MVPFYNFTLLPSDLTYIKQVDNIQYGFYFDGISVYSDNIRKP